MTYYYVITILNILIKMTRLTWLLAVTGLASARGYDPEACLNSFTEVASNAIARRTVIITSLLRH